MQQASLFASTAAARQEGQRLGELCLDAAMRFGDFSPTAAGDYIVDWLDRHGPTKGEELVDAAKLAGHRPRDDHAFGRVFQILAQADRIEQYGYALRRKGHGMAGGVIWSICRRKASPSTTRTTE